ncbi:hypothetical protein DENSPDRAFT_563814 [Dentipellis sp. KUC8613]|nr:hypothetical protein DENSPDRAFT_563814 [Dentipellis sp. KUC8613]
MAKKKPPTPAESLEARVVRLEKELMDATHKNGALQKQSSREKEDFERQISRLKEDMAQEAKRMEECVEEARRSRDELKQLKQALEKNDKTLKQATSRAATYKVQLDTSKVELAKLRAQMKSAPPSVRGSAPTPKVEAQSTAPPEIKVKTENEEVPRLKRPTTYHPQSSSSDEEGSSKRRKTEHREEVSHLYLSGRASSDGHSSWHVF